MGEARGKAVHIKDDWEWGLRCNLLLPTALISSSISRIRKLEVSVRCDDAHLLSQHLAEAKGVQAPGQSGLYRETSTSLHSPTLPKKNWE